MTWSSRVPDCVLKVGSALERDNWEYFWSNEYICNGRRFTKSALRILLLCTFRISSISYFLVSSTPISTRSSLMQRDRKHTVTWNHVKCCTNVPQTALEKACNRWMTFKVIQGHCRCYHLKAIYNFLLVFHCKYISVLHFFRDINTYLLKKIKTSCHLDQAHLASSL